MPTFEVKENVAYDYISLKNADREFFDIIAFGTLALRNEHSFKTLKALLDNKNFGKVYCDINLRSPFYTRETVIYKVKSCSEKGIDINSIQATLSNTAFKISIPEIKTDKVDDDLLHVTPPKSIYDKIALQKEYVETTDGKRFETAQRSDGDGGYGVPAGENKIINYYQTFNLTKYDTTDEITVHIFTNKGEEITIELEK